MGGQQFSGPRGGRAERGARGLLAGPIQWAVCPPGPAGGDNVVRQSKSWSAGSAGLRPQAVVARVCFEYERANLDADDRSALNDLAKAVTDDMRKTGGVAHLLVVGHTDHRGDPGYNLKLGASRALAVHRFLTKAVPEAVVWRARTSGERRAAQPGLCGPVPESRMADDRRVDVVFGRVHAITGDDETVTIPDISSVVDEAIGMLKGVRGAYPNQADRLLCMLPKLKPARTPENDSYWHFQDFELAWRPSYGPSGFDPARAEKGLRKRRRSARQFLQRAVATESDKSVKLKRLLYLDEEIFQSWMKTGQKLAVLAGSSDEKMYPYWLAVRETLRRAGENPQTLYSCVVPRKGS